MKKYILLLAVMLTSHIMIIAQISSYDWHVNMGNSLTDIAQSVAVDNSGNIFVTGTMNGVIDLDPSPGNYNLTSNGGSNDFFVAKYDPDGNIIWGFRRGSSSYDYARKIVVTSTNDIIVVGEFGGSFDFDPSAGGNTTLNAGTGKNGFVAKYDSSGNFIWAFGLGDPSSYDLVSNIDIDVFDNFYIIGSFQGTTDFNPGSGTANLSSANDALFVAKYNSAGTYKWAFKVAASSSITASGISIDSLSNVYITGAFSGTADFNPTSGVLNLTSSANDDIFIAKYSTSSSLVWAHQIGSSGDDIGIDIDATASGIFYLTGHIEGTCDFDVTPASEIVFTSGAINGFLACYDNNADLNWAFSLGQPGGGSQVVAVASTVNRKAIITGWVAGNVDFDPSANTYIMNLPISMATGYIAVYDENGLFEGLSLLETSGHIYPSDIVLDSNENVLLSGKFGGTCDFDPSATINQSTSNGYDDAFLAKYSPTQTGIHDQTIFENVLVYPNPANSQLYIEGLPEESVVEVMTMHGASLKVINHTSKTTSINLDGLAGGIYILQVSSKDQKFTSKIIKY